MKPDVPDNLILAFLTGTADDRQLDELSEWIAASPEHARYLSAIANVDLVLTRHFRQRAIEQPADEMHPLVENLDQEVWQEVLNSAAEARLHRERQLQELLRLEQDAKVLPHSVDSDSAMPQPRRQTEGALTWREVADASGYLLVNAVKSAPAKWVAAAAVILLAATLLIVLNTSNGTATDPGIVEGTPGPPPLESPRPVVAKLAAQHDARWQATTGTTAPGLGDGLHPGQRLTLTEGLAEIMTARGTRLLLEAPCEVEFTEDNNALQLVSGQLFASVPPQATGFTVQTPTARIIDIGTEFGVEADEEGTTRLQVYDGEVRAAPIGADGEVGEYASLTTNQAVSIQLHTGLQADVFDPGRHEQDILIAGMRPEPEECEMWWRGDVSMYQQTGREKSEAIQVFLEKPGVLITEDLPVDLNWPGRWLPNKQAQQNAVVKAGERVDVYLVHYDPPSGDGFADEGNFKLRFDGKILGVICDSQSLAAAPESIRNRTRYPELAKGRGGPGLDFEFGDRVRIHPNTITLQCELIATTFYDQMLVLVRSRE